MPQSFHKNNGVARPVNETVVLWQGKVILRKVLFINNLKI